MPFPLPFVPKLRYDAGGRKFGADFELYTGAMTGPFTVLSNKGFQRRGDLINPAPLLDKLSNDIVSSVGSAMMSSAMGRLPG